jgi:hypothetical protein
MKTWLITIGLVLSFLQGNLFANTKDVDMSMRIQEDSPYDCNRFSDLYASRGEDYLILGDDQKALEDFLRSYEYSLKSGGGIEETRLSFRSLFGAFLVYIRLEDLESAKEVYSHLDSILDSGACFQCAKSTARPSKRLARPVLANHPDYPIYGSDQISIRECLDRVDTTVEAITILIATVKRTEVRTVAVAFIRQLENKARNCCIAGGIWKGCLQVLVNKLHYWKVLGIPADPAWD